MVGSSIATFRVKVYPSLYHFLFSFRWSFSATVWRTSLLREGLVSSHLCCQGYHHETADSKIISVCLHYSQIGNPLVYYYPSWVTSFLVNCHKWTFEIQILIWYVLFHRCTVQNKCLLAINVYKLLYECNCFPL